VYDRESGKAKFLFDSKEKLEHAKLSAMTPITISARDGIDLAGYLTVPATADPRDEGRPKEPVPTVLLVHDGPWDRVSSGYDPVHQWLASRGYAVLSVNFRGSIGLGKKLANAGNLEWGGKMQSDLLDAAAWAVKENIADPTKLAIMGTGYGGYAVLYAM